MSADAGPILFDIAIGVTGSFAVGSAASWLPGFWSGWAVANEQKDGDNLARVMEA